MLPTLRKLFALCTLLGTLVLVQEVSAATRIKKPKRVCAAANGELLVKSKCKKDETTLSANNLNQILSSGAKLIGPKGPEGQTGPAGPIGLQGLKGAQGLAGVKGTKGLIDFSGCRIVANSDSNVLTPSNSGVDVTVSCNPQAEFIFEDDFAPFIFPNSVGTKVFIQSREVNTHNVAGDTREYEITYYANRLVTVGSGIYILNIRALCCPR